MQVLKFLILNLFILISFSSIAFPPGYAAKQVKGDANAYFQGRVLETMTKGKYTYALVKSNKDKKTELWMATASTKLSKGDNIEFLKGMAMKDFHSKSLDKTFKEIYFSDYFKVLKSNKTVANDKKIKILKKAEYSVADIFEQNAKLKDKIVKIRAKVVKVSNQIMGKNWVHIQDGTNFKGQYDLVVTTMTKVKIGDEVVVSAKIAINKDFGYGYKYPILLEEGKFK